MTNTPIATRYKIFAMIAGNLCMHICDEVFFCFSFSVVVMFFHILCFVFCVFWVRAKEKKKILSRPKRYLEDVECPTKKKRRLSNQKQSINEIEHNWKIYEISRAESGTVGPHINPLSNTKTMDSPCNKQIMCVTLYILVFVFLFVYI